jgi:hypothetical protein
MFRLNPRYTEKMFLVYLILVLWYQDIRNFFFKEVEILMHLEIKNLVEVFFGIVVYIGRR